MIFYICIGLLPMCLRRKTERFSNGPGMSCLACYGGGVILATCFTHMMPEVKNKQEQYLVSQTHAPG